MKSYTLLLNIDISSSLFQACRACDPVVSDQLEVLRLAEGVLRLNENAWLFDLDVSKGIYDQALSTLEQRGVQLMCLDISDNHVCTLLESVGNEKFLEKARDFFEKS